MEGAETDAASGWMQQIDGYCERTDPSYWSEPVNALTNIAFIIAAFWIWRRVSGRGMPLAEVLCGLLFAVGVGSYLWHTHATAWSGMADVLAIVLFILVYIFAANRHYWGLEGVKLWAATGAFLPYAAVMVPVFAALPFFEISAPYWPVALLIGIYALALWDKHPATARGLAIGAGLLCVSLTFRSVDEILCAQIPLGTHFVWHILNGVMLGWMIEVYARHRSRAAV